jgi:hypothetical protein
MKRRRKKRFVTKQTLTEWQAINSPKYFKSAFILSKAVAKNVLKKLKYQNPSR